MKQRVGFVSNSSSSSFVIGTRKKLTEKSLREIFKTDNPLFKRIADEMIKAFLSSSSEKTLFDFLDDYCAKDISELPENYQKSMERVKKEHFNLYTGSFSNEDSGIEAYLCDLDINYSDDEIFIYKEGGY